MKRFAQRFPFWFSILVSLTAILGQIWPVWITTMPLSMQIIAGRFTSAVIAILILSILGWWREAGFVRFSSWRVILPYLPLYLVAILAVSVTFISGIAVIDPAILLLGILSFGVGGFIEEALFRGIVLRALIHRGLMRAAILSALVFSLVHLANLLLGQSLGATILQLVRAFLLGFAFVAPLAITRNIWPLVILHALINFTSFLASGNITLINTQEPEIGQVLGEVIVFGILAIIGFWQVKRFEQKSKAASITNMPVP